MPCSNLYTLVLPGLWRWWLRDTCRVVGTAAEVDGTLRLSDNHCEGLVVIDVRDVLRQSSMLAGGAMQKKGRSWSCVKYIGPRKDVSEANAPVARGSERLRHPGAMRRKWWKQVVVVFSGKLAVVSCRGCDSQSWTSKSEGDAPVEPDWRSRRGCKGEGVPLSNRV
jgi:hypothetical protein